MKYLVSLLVMFAVVCAASASPVALRRKPPENRRLTLDEIRALCPEGKKNPFLLDLGGGRLATTYRETKPLTAR